MSESSSSPVDPLNPAGAPDARGPSRLMSEVAYRDWVHEQVAASLLRRLMKLTGAGLVALVAVGIGYVELVLKDRILDEVDGSVDAAEDRLRVEVQRAATLAVAQDRELVPELIQELVGRDPDRRGPSLVDSLVAEQEFVSGVTREVVKDQQLRTSVQTSVREAMVNEEAKAWIVEGVQKTIEGSPSVLVDALVGDEQRTGLLADALGDVLEYSLIAERCYRILDDESRPPSVRQRAIDMLVLFEEDRERLEVSSMRWVRAGGADAEFLARCLEGAVASLVAPGAGGDGLCTDGVLAGLRAFAGSTDLAQPLPPRLGDAAVAALLRVSEPEELVRVLGDEGELPGLRSLACDALVGQFASGARPAALPALARAADPTDRGYFARGWTGDASLTEDVSAALLAVDRAALVAAPGAARAEAFRAVWRAWEFSTGVGEADWSASSRARGLVDALFDSDVDAIRSEAHRFPLGLEGLRDDLLGFASELESGATSVDTLKPRDELERLFTDSFSEVGIPPYEVLVHLLVPADWTELGDLSSAPGADPRRNRWLLAVWTSVLQAAEGSELGVSELARGLYAQAVLERWPIDYGEPEEPELAAAVLAALAHGDDGLAEEHVGRVCAWVEEALTLSEGKRLFAAEDAAVDERTGFIFDTLEVAALALRDSEGLASLLRTPLALVSGDAFCAWVRAGAPAASRVALHVATIAEEAAGATFGAGLTAPRYGTLRGDQEACVAFLRGAHGLVAAAGDEGLVGESAELAAALAAAFVRTIPDRRRGAPDFAGELARCGAAEVFAREGLLSPPDVAQLAGVLPWLTFDDGVWRRPTPWSAPTAGSLAAPVAVDAAGYCVLPLEGLPSDGWVRIEHPTAAAPADAAIFVLGVQPATDGPARIEVLRVAGLQGSISIAGATHCLLQAPAGLGDGYVVQYQPPEYGTTRSTARRLDVQDAAVELAGLAFSEACREHWFQVGPFDAEHSLALETLALRDCDTLVELYRGDDPLSLASDDDGGAEHYASRLAYSAEPGVTYFVRLANYTGQPAGEYTLVASLSSN